MKYSITFKNPRLEPMTVSETDGLNALKAMASNGIFEHKGRFYNGSAIDAVQPIEQQKFAELPMHTERTVSQETLKKVALELRAKGFRIAEKY